MKVRVVISWPWLAILGVFAWLNVEYWHGFFPGPRHKGWPTVIGYTDLMLCAVAGVTFLAVLLVVTLLAAGVIEDT